MAKMGNNAKNIDTICVVCGEKSFDFFVNKNNFDLYRCKNCGLIFVWPMPQSTTGLYSQDYFDGAKHGFGYVDYDKDKQAMDATFNFYLDKIETFSTKKGNLFDVGAATGYFLEIAKKRKWDVMGIEISDFAADLARAKGINVITGKLENLKVQDSYFDILTLWDVVEHFPNPKSQLLLAQKLLKNGGIIAINTPDAGSFIAKLLGKHWHLLVPPEHLIIFNQKNLSLLLKSCGFDVLWIGKVGKKFTFQYALQIISNKLNLKPITKVAEFFKNNSFDKLNIPINLRDNFFIIARKK